MAKTPIPSGTERLLAIDVGTQSVRALLFDLRGEVSAAAKVPLVPYFSEHPGWAEQDPEYYWSSLCQACQELWAQDGVSSDAVVGVALTTQRATVVNVDSEGKPLRPAMLWLDQRRTEGFNIKTVGPLWSAALKVVGMTEVLEYFMAEAESNWLRVHQPEVWRRTHKFLLLSGYLTYRLCGRYVDSIGCQMGFIPFDCKRHRWAPSHDFKWKALGIEPKMLPELSPPGTVMGQIGDQVAVDTGIPSGTPLVAAAGDKACEVLGAGCSTPEIACLSYGTTATINTTHRRYVESIPFVPPFAAAIPGAYHPEIRIYRGYWMVSWFKEEFGHREVELATKRGVAAEQLFDELAGSVPPGSMGLTLQPYWSPGVKIPGPEAKGAIIGFGAVHTRAHLYRAILEGIAYALREGKERIERRSKERITSLRVAGGGSQSDLALQITADVFGLPVSRPHTHEASGLGAAIDAAVGLGLHPDFDRAIAEMTRLGDTFDPDPQAVQIYDELYRRVFSQMYGKLKTIYQEIRAITGYPPRAGR